MKLDPYNHKERYLRWKKEIKEAGCVEGISKVNSDLTIKYVYDMEIGINVSAKSVKGPRSFIRLNNLKQLLPNTLMLPNIFSTLMINNSDMVQPPTT